MKNPRSSLKKFGWKIRGRLFGFGDSPEIDWRIILISIMIMTILVIVFSVFIFIKIDKREIFVVEKPEEEREKFLDTSLLRETVLYYQSKALEFERIKSMQTLTTDPSF